MRLRIVTAALAATLMSAPAVAQDARLLPLAGTWIGTGEAREGVNQPWETASCEITVEWRGGLRSDGACEGARGRFTAGGIITVDGDQLSGAFLSPYFADLGNTGVFLDDGALVATYELMNEEGGITRFRLTVRVPQMGVMTMQTEMLVDGTFHEVGHLTLQAQ